MSEASCLPKSPSQGQSSFSSSHMTLSRIWTFFSFLFHALPIRPLPSTNAPGRRSRAPSIVFSSTTEPLMTHLLNVGNRVIGRDGRFGKRATLSSTTAMPNDRASLSHASAGVLATVSSCRQYRAPLESEGCARAKREIATHHSCAACGSPFRHFGCMCWDSAVSATSRFASLAPLPRSLFFSFWYLDLRGRSPCSLMSGSIGQKHIIIDISKYARNGRTRKGLLLNMGMGGPENSRNILDLNLT